MVPNHKPEDGEMQKLAIAVVTAAVLFGSGGVMADQETATFGPRGEPTDDHPYFGNRLVAGIRMSYCVTYPDGTKKCFEVEIRNAIPLSPLAAPVA